MSKPTNERTQQHEIEIDAPIEVVWKAIAEAEELVRWFCEEARTDLHQGGTRWVSWGEGMSGEGIIEEWNPPQALRVRLTGAAPDADSAAEAPPSPQQINEYLLESRGNRTVLRLVHSGIPSSSNWDGYYDGLDRGWQLFLLALRHYLENHRGEPRTNLVIMRPVSGELNEAWKKLIEALGLRENPQAPDSLATANI